jgi:hypothetical protein
MKSDGGIKSGATLRRRRLFFFKACSFFRECVILEIAVAVTVDFAAQTNLFDYGCLPLHVEPFLLISLFGQQFAA